MDNICDICKQDIKEVILRDKHDHNKFEEMCLVCFDKWVKDNKQTYPLSELTEACKELGWIDNIKDQQISKDFASTVNYSSIRCSWDNKNG